MKKIFSLVLIWVAGCFAFQASADDVFYVSPNGNDVNAGTSQAAAFKTLSKAVSVVQVGTPTTIYLEANAEFNSPATITLGEGRELSLIGDNTIVHSGNVPYLGQQILRFAPNTTVKVEGITFRNGCARDGVPGGAIWFEGNTLEVNRCSFINNDASSSGPALASRGKDVLITNSVFHQNKVAGGYGYGGVLWHSGLYPGTEATGSLTIRNCAFTENEAKDDTHGDVISLGHAYRNSGITNGYTNVTYLEVTNCLFKDNTNSAASAGLRPGPAAIYLADTRDNLEVNIINNTFYKAKALAIPFFFDTPYRLVNNVFYNNEGYVIKCTNTSDERDPFIAYNNVVVGEMIKVDDPAFNTEKEAYGNQIIGAYSELKLATVAKNDNSYVPYLPITDASSLLINSGLSSTAGKAGFDKEYIPTTDIRGVAVSGAKDIGSFEFPSTDNGLQGVNAESLFSIYRNGDLAVVKNHTGKLLNLKIYLVDGRCIYSAGVAGEMNIHRSELEVPGGLLIIAVNNGQVSASKKVILF